MQYKYPEVRLNKKSFSLWRIRFFNGIEDRIITGWVYGNIVSPSQFMD